MFQTKFPRELHTPNWLRVAVNVAAGAALGVMAGAVLLLALGTIG
jgi:uncharacterized protein involved in exopolysaccharide biosynthesis